MLHERRLIAAVVVSLAAHAAIAWLGGPPPAPPAAPRPLEARLAPSPAPLPRIDPAPDPQPTRAARRPAPRGRVSTGPQLAAATPLAVPADSVTGEAPAADDPPASEPPTAQSEAPPVTAPPPEVAPSLPKRVELLYTLYLGTDKFDVGRAAFTWETDQGAYRLMSASETTGIVDLFRPQRLTYVSEGRLTEDGLRPENFAMSRMRRGQTDAAQAHLDWEARRLTYGRPAHKRTVDLPPASQDIVSFVFQLALQPPAPGRVRLPITNGTRFEIYEIEVLAQERIETPLGLLDVLPLRQLRKEGSEGIEVWLAVDYRYLPVKVRFLDRDGNAVGEQIVSEMRISQQ